MARPARPPRDRPQLTSPKRKSFLNDSRQLDFIEAEPCNSAATLNGASIFGHGPPPQTLSPKLGHRPIPHKSTRSRSLERRVHLPVADADADRSQNHSLTPRTLNSFTWRNDAKFMTGREDSFSSRNAEPVTPRTNDCFTPRSDGSFTPRTSSRSGARHRVLKSIEVANKMMDMSIDDYELLKETGELPVDAE